MNKYTSFQQAAVEQNNKKTFLVTNKTVSYGEIEKHIEQLTTLFTDAGLVEGNRLILASNQDQAMIEIFLALLRNGLTAVIIDPNSTEIEARGIINRSAPDGIIADKTYWDSWGLDSFQNDIFFSLIIEDSSPSKNNLIGKLLKKKRTADNTNYPQLLTSLRRTPPPVSVNSNTTAYILFTSGTTSKPKGVEISAGALCRHLNTLSKQFSYRNTTRILNVLPLSHVDGLVQGPVLAYYNGASVYRPYPFSVQNIIGILDTIYCQRITHMVAVPTMLTMMLKLGRELTDVFNTEDFKFTISAAAYLETGLWEDFEKLTKKQIVNIYGLTETVTGSLFNGPDDFTRQIGTLGKPVDCEVRIISTDGVDVAKGETGELLIKGDHLMAGYFNDEEATAETIQNGWLYTGDLVKCDHNGFYHYIGRSKNVIIRGGLNIIPEQVATVLLQHPDVAEAVVVGAPEPEWGEVVIALIVPARSSTLDTSNLIEFCRQSLSEYKVPHRILSVSKLPRGRTGKIILSEVYSLLKQQDQNTPTTQGGILECVIDIAAKIFQTTPDKLTYSSNPDNTAGWDSLGHMHLIAALEKQFNVTLTTHDIITINSLDTAVDIIRDRQQAP